MKMDQFEEAVLRLFGVVKSSLTAHEVAELLGIDYSCSSTGLKLMREAGQVKVMKPTTRPYHYQINNISGD